MSPAKRLTARTFARLKGERLAVLTAYDYFTARFLEAAGVDALLVGDSVNMVYHGHPTTLSADMPLMLAHTSAVVRGAANTLVIADRSTRQLYEVTPSGRTSSSSIHSAGPSARTSRWAPIVLPSSVRAVSRLKPIRNSGREDAATATPRTRANGTDSAAKAGLPNASAASMPRAANAAYPASLGLADVVRRTSPPVSAAPGPSRAGRARHPRRSPAAPRARAAT